MGCTDSREVEDEEVLSGYTTISQIGAGSYGTVYSARHQRTGCEVAIKLVDADHTPEEEFEHEVKMLELLQHPRVVRLHQAARLDCWALVMDLYEGGTVDDAVQAHWATRGWLAPAVVQNVTRMMVEATAWMHEKRIVHRDLKQTNFLVDRSDIADPDIKVVLCDVATATVVPEGRRKHRQLGTSVYWAPEVWERSYGLPADIWALGVIAYTVSLKAWPFQGEEQVRLQPLVWPEHLVCGRWGRDASRVVGSFVCGMLRKKEADRLTAATALEHAFLAPGAAMEALGSAQATDVADDKSVATPSTQYSDASFDVLSSEGSTQPQ